MDSSEQKRGKVYIVGAGPGDPGLMTVRGLACLKEADVVIYDYLANPRILREARSDARLIYVGKKGGCHSISQDELNDLLLKEARAGRRVTRLNGGDPFLFGRGGEEAQILARQGIDFEIVPGVASAVAVPAYAGIPLTHRRLTSTVAFVTGHEDPMKEESSIDWKSLAGIGTVVFLMGVKNLTVIASRLMEAGKTADAPAALIRWGTMPEQRTLTAPLCEIAARAEQEGFAPPAILVVGDVVELREELSWFEKKPLFGKTVLVTRPEEQAGHLADLLEQEGAQVLRFPLIEIAPPRSWAALDGAVGNIQDYDWIVFSSVNGVKYFFDRLEKAGKTRRDLAGSGICAIGSVTAAALDRKGVFVDIMPDDFVSEALLKAFEGHDVSGKRILLPRAAEARDVIPETLQRRGARVDDIHAYQATPVDKKIEDLESLVSERPLDIITFTSPSAVRSFVRIIGSRRALVKGVQIASIGPVTAEALKEAGLPCRITAKEYTAPGLVRAIVECWFEAAAGNG
ncbi:MAG: uroporphyrinogen-III C-methyltransferase [Deltaproteobacteria bacterium]|nr:uroporphyrinogen-III C-methyltransferase [Deltaproteobacteria bacterium]